MGNDEALAELKHSASEYLRCQSGARAGAKRRGRWGAGGLLRRRRRRSNVSAGFVPMGENGLIRLYRRVDHIIPLGVQLPRLCSRRSIPTSDYSSAREEGVCIYLFLIFCVFYGFFSGKNKWAVRVACVVARAWSMSVDH